MMHMDSPPNTCLGHIDRDNSASKVPGTGSMNRRRYAARFFSVAYGRNSIVFAAVHVSPDQNKNNDKEIRPDQTAKVDLADKFLRLSLAQTGKI